MVIEKCAVVDGTVQALPSMSLRRCVWLRLCGALKRVLMAFFCALNGAEKCNFAHGKHDLRKQSLDIMYAMAQLVKMHWSVC